MPIKRGSNELSQSLLSTYNPKNKIRRQNGQSKKRPKNTQPIDRKNNPISLSNEASIYHSCKSGSDPSKVVKLLCKTGSSILQYKYFDNTSGECNLLHIVCQREKPDFLMSLVDYLATHNKDLLLTLLEQKDSQGYKPLELSLYQFKTEEEESLVSQSVQYRLLNEYIQKYYLPLQGLEKRDIHLNGAHSQSVNLHEQRKDKAFKFKKLLGYLKNEWADKDEKDLISELEQVQVDNNCFYDDDCSDDSDSEDQQALDELSNDRYTRSLRDIQTISRSESCQWFKGDSANISNRESSGHLDDLVQLVYELKQQGGQMDKASVWQRLDSVRSKIKRDRRQRESLNLSTNDEQVIKDMNTLNGILQEHSVIGKEVLEGITTSFCIYSVRGINYMQDRWTIASRRKHRRLDEVELPQYPESILGQLPYHYYQQLHTQSALTHNYSHQMQLGKRALRLGQTFKDLQNTPACVSSQHNQQGSQYCCNSIAEDFQHQFSNGIDNFLNKLRVLRQNYPNSWGQYFSSALNPFNATSSTPYHACRYAQGMKSYYQQSLVPSYLQDGSIAHSHLGKVYLLISPLSDYLGQSLVHHVPLMDRQARVKIGGNIAPEKEHTWLGAIKGGRVQYQQPIKMPSFKGDYKQIYEAKYGMDEPLFKAFQYLLQTFPKNSNFYSSKGNVIDLNDEIISLLQEWIACHLEMVLIQKAKQIASERGQVLVYLNNDNQLSFYPDNPNLFTHGDSNLAKRDNMHVKRGIREDMAESLGNNQKFSDAENYPEFTFFKGDTIDEYLSQRSKEGPLFQDLVSKLKKNKDKISLGVEEPARNNIDLFSNNKNMFFEGANMSSNIDAAFPFDITEQHYSYDIMIMNMLVSYLISQSSLGGTHIRLVEQPFVSYRDEKSPDKDERVCDINQSNECNLIIVVNLTEDYLTSRHYDRPQTDWGVLSLDRSNPDQIRMNVFYRKQNEARINTLVDDITKQINAQPEIQRNKPSLNREDTGPFMLEKVNAILKKQPDYQEANIAKCRQEHFQYLRNYINSQDITHTTQQTAQLS